MKRIAISESDKEGQKKSEWVTPELSCMSIEQTLSGRLNNPSENMASVNNNGRPPGGGGS